ncbi:hypothetical protein AB0E04_24290 [Streptomyces sp. NPDC048251]|uniref:hypothetical protein n=1 Tax=Streptomyces sp. NPDC048251 TaxID=3154501 RepID=UPI00341DE536
MRELIDLADAFGGPDNVSCVVADGMELRQQQERAACGCTHYGKDTPAARAEHRGVRFSPVRGKCLD